VPLCLDVSLNKHAVLSPVGWGEVLAALKSGECTRSLELQTELHPQYGCESEPLYGLIRRQHDVWVDTLKSAAAYPPREAARHTQKLQGYVQAAAVRSAGQLEPELRKQLLEALGMTA
jgi:hypothetical protein